MKALLGVVLATLVGFLADGWGLSLSQTFLLIYLCSVAGILCWLQIKESNLF